MTTPSLLASSSEYGSRRSALPSRVDLRLSSCSPYIFVEDQGAEVSCVAHAFAQSLYCAVNKSEPYAPFAYPAVSVLFQDAATRSSDNSKGVSFNVVAELIQQSHSETFARYGLVVVHLSNILEELKFTIARGYPLVLGYQVNAAADRFHRSNEFCAQHGYILPRFSADPNAVSGHTVLAVGYDDSVDSFVCRNSWGRDWGYGGHFLARFADVGDAEFFTDVMAIVDEATLHSLGRRPGSPQKARSGRWTDVDQLDDLLAGMPPLGVREKAEGSRQWRRSWG